jgi:predicted RNA binding protein YcfA (HicA-like mRNA interferase family)
LKIPRDVSGEDFARALRKFGYSVTRQSGSHMRLSSNQMGREHHVTIPAHTSLKIGTISQILSDVANYLEMSREQLIQDLF